MPRKPQVSRTLKTTLATTKILNVSTEKISKHVFRIAGIIRTEQKLRDKIKPMLAPEQRLIDILDYKYQIVQMTMTEQEYINHAEIFNEMEILK